MKKIINFAVLFFFCTIIVISSGSSAFANQNKSLNAKLFLKVANNRPYGLTFDNEGSMYIVCAPPTGAGTLSKVTPKGKVQKIATLDGTFISEGIEIGRDKKLYIPVGNKLLRVSPKGKIEIIATGFTRCIDIKFDLKGNMYITDDGAEKIYKITPQLKKSVFIDMKTKSGNVFTLPSLAFDKDCKNLYVIHNQKIVKYPIDKNGNPGKELDIANSEGSYTCLVSDKAGNIFGGIQELSLSRINKSNSIKTLSIEGIPLESFGDGLVGMKFGEKGFDQNSIYATYDDGIYKIDVSLLK